ncbi:DUF4157 domain-containing protein [Actinomadura syzygii]|uniref:DUF4157 domain-containing protein n=1 Tax=Actinomadura syzygii TaxID=1427538 RepID=A0A5D0U9L0_9ACTN|nr:DUF4157 domain-containing protein [Actinomadura syzygii]TYC14460.1 DUF4157 domain-containing protein [Actinomadura syzygii]
MRELRNQRDDDGARRTPSAGKARAGDAATAGVTPSARSVVALQRLVGNAAVARMLSARSQGEDGEQAAAVQREHVEQVLRSPGRPLEAPVRAEWEARYGTDLSGVRVHTDSTAHQAAVSVQAVAFTSGSHIAFQQGQYAPGSPGGNRLLGHELSHYNQQRSGTVPGTDNGNGLSVSDPSDALEKAADADADAALRRPVPAEPEHDHT